MARRPADHRQHVGQAGTRAHPGRGIGALGQREETARERFGAIDLHRRRRRVARREFRSRGQPDAARHRGQNEAAIDIEHGTFENGTAERAVMHVIAALHGERNGIAERPEKVVRPGAERHQCLARRQTPLRRLERPAALALFEKPRLAGQEAAAAGDEQAGIGLDQGRRIGNRSRIPEIDRAGERTHEMFFVRRDRRRVEQIEGDAIRPQALGLGTALGETARLSDRASSNLCGEWRRRRRPPRRALHARQASARSAVRALGHSARRPPARRPANKGAARAKAGAAPRRDNGRPKSGSSRSAEAPRHRAESYAGKSTRVRSSRHCRNSSLRRRLPGGRRGRHRGRGSADAALPIRRPCRPRARRCRRSGVPQIRSRFWNWFAPQRAVCACRLSASGDGRQQPAGPDAVIADVGSCARRPHHCRQEDTSLPRSLLRHSPADGISQNSPRPGQGSRAIWTTGRHRARLPVLSQKPFGPASAEPSRSFTRSLSILPPRMRDDHRHRGCRRAGQGGVAGADGSYGRLTFLTSALCGHWQRRLCHTRFSVLHPRDSRDISRKETPSAQHKLAGPAPDEARE